MSKNPSPEKKTLLPLQSHSAFRSAYGPKRKVALSFPDGTGRTKQSFKDECDINKIMARFQQTGIIEFRDQNQAQYGDVTGADFQTAMLVVAEGKTMFFNLPAKVRDEFDNDPALFLEFVSDERNKPEMARMGLLKPEVASAILEATPPAPPPSSVAPATPPQAPAPSPAPGPVVNNPLAGPKS